MARMLAPHRGRTSFATSWPTSTARAVSKVPDARRTELSPSACWLVDLDPVEPLQDVLHLVRDQFGEAPAARNRDHGLL